MFARWLGGSCLLASVSLLAACVSTAPELTKDEQYQLALEEQEASAEVRGDLALTLAGSEARGTFTHEGAVIHFETRVLRAAVETEITLHGMTLLSTIDRETGAFDLDGFASDSGEDTQMTEPDRAALRALEAALGDDYRAAVSRSPGAGDAPAATGPQASPTSAAPGAVALDFLNRAITLWGQYSTTLPLARVFYGRLDQSASLCSSVNRKGAWGIWTAATHDCNSSAGDCSDWWGCDRWDDNSTTDYVFMSMHPAGSCADTTFFGNSATTFSCFEPSHPGNTEYAYGDCFGRCGAGCGSSTVFTRDCVDHDQCVRLGHDLASFWCDDELSGAAWDMTWGSNCSGVTFTVNYNWAGTAYQGACSTSWNNANDGCDVGCQFIDADCSR